MKMKNVEINNKVDCNRHPLLPAAFLFGLEEGEGSGVGAMPDPEPLTEMVMGFLASKSSWLSGSVGLGNSGIMP